MFHGGGGGGGGGFRFSLVLFVFTFELQNKTGQVETNMVTQTRESTQRKISTREKLRTLDEVHGVGSWFTKGLLLYLSEKAKNRCKMFVLMSPI